MLPRFRAARRYELPLLGGAVVLIIAALATPAAARMVEAALWLAAAGFLSACMMAFARARLAEGESVERKASKVGSKPPSAPKPQAIRDWPAHLQHLVLRGIADWIPDVLSLSEWPQSLVALGSGSLAVHFIVQWWRLAQHAGDPAALRLPGVILVLSAFPLLVLQRMHAGLSADLLPEAPQLERLLRLPLAACLGQGGVMFAIAGGFGWAIQVERIIAAVVLAAAVEMLLRGAVTVFVPWPPIERRLAIADSTVAGLLLRLRPPTLQSLNTTVRQRFGINLSRSWALSFVQKAALPLVAGIGLVTWLFTGVTALGINQRGVYERLGEPAEVLGPGVHLHLPWPLGILRTVEIGVVHQLPIEFVLADQNGQVPAQAEEEEQRVAAEADPPASADRLWDDAHPYEGSYLIASEDNARQSFQLVDVDMAVLYQIGLSDEAARNALYRVTNVEDVIQALSGQILVRYLAQHQLLELLGESRETLSADFRTRLQQELDLFHSGVDVLAISIEAIHPPPGAASAYHDVQAAEIRAGTHVAGSLGNAARTQQGSQTLATRARNDAKAAAVERVDQARITSTLFGGDLQSYVKDGDAFLLERWLDNLAAGLAKTKVVIIDHRLKDSEVPTVDLRTPLADQRNPSLDATADAQSSSPPSQSLEPPAGNPAMQQQLNPDYEGVKGDE
ncbi:MAG TPA: SPFH domain-containing protein [Nevskiaceae bacterium]|nr:SPFH domain-containing protein [Nevskiaceae bacterium]